MRDEHKGSFAVAAGILLFLIKFAALQSLVMAHPLALLLIPTLGRWGMALAVVLYPYAREKGLGRDMKDHAGWREGLLASMIAIAASWFCAGAWGLAAAGLALLVWFSGIRFTLARIPGLTGDIYGMLNELIEVTLVVAFSLVR
jgi:adenosylcobinamide-GDP ribazoletransferase